MAYPTTDGLLCLGMGCVAYERRASTPSSFSSEGRKGCGSTAASSIVPDECSIRRDFANSFLLSIAIKIIYNPELPELRKCQMVGCEQHHLPDFPFKDAREMFQHLLECSQFEHGRYWCWRHTREESFVMGKQGSCIWSRQGMMSRMKDRIQRKMSGRKHSSSSLSPMAVPTSSPEIAPIPLPQSPIELFHRPHTPELSQALPAEALVAAGKLVEAGAEPGLQSCLPALPVHVETKRERFRWSGRPITQSACSQTQASSHKQAVVESRAGKLVEDGRNATASAVSLLAAPWSLPATQSRSWSPFHLPSQASPPRSYVESAISGYRPDIAYSQGAIVPPRPSLSVDTSGPTYSSVLSQSPTEEDMSDFPPSMKLGQIHLAGQGGLHVETAGSRGSEVFAMPSPDEQPAGPRAELAGDFARTSCQDPAWAPEDGPSHWCMAHHGTETWAARPAASATHSYELPGSDASYARPPNQSQTSQSPCGPSVCLPQSSVAGLDSGILVATTPPRQNSADTLATLSSTSGSPRAGIQLRESFLCPHAGCGWLPEADGIPENWRSYLGKHLRQTHSNKQYPCPHCPKQYSRNDNLGVHIKRQHGQDQSYPLSTSPSKRGQAEEHDLQMAQTKRHRRLGSLESPDDDDDRGAGEFV